MYKKIIPKKLHDLSGAALKEAVIKKKKKEIVKLVCRQTNYTEDEAEKLLEEEKYNYMKVIKKYMNPTPKEIEKKNDKSLNQQIIGEIRNFMDQGVKLTKYRKKQAAYAKRVQQMQQRKKAEAERRKKALEDGNKKL